MSTKPASDNSRLLPSERQRLISQLALERGVLRISELANEFGVSEMTIRRDLTLLEEAGRLERTFGGALVPEQAAHEMSYTIRLRTHQPQKEQIAAYAATLVQNGDTIAIDASTTGLALAKKLAGREVTVVTNSLDIAQELRATSTKVILTGGWYRDAAGSVVGPLAQDNLRRLRVDHVFFSAKGVLIPDGFLDSDLDEIEVKRSMLRSAARVTALVDASKFDARALGAIAALNEVDLIVTDSQVTTETLERLEAHGAAYHVVQELIHG